MDNKQIEEMAKITCDMYRRDREKKCAGIQECNMKCLHYQRCEALYNANFRKQEWISVDERLPDKGGKYLVYRELCNGLSLMNIINYDPNYDGHAMWFLFDGEWGDCEVNNVTHWMPLPEPPKMKGYENG